MKVAILGYGVEGKSAEQYFAAKGADIKIFDKFTEADIDTFHLEDYDLVVRTPSIRPRPGWTSLTKIFFKECPCPIIGVTGTKGKGTTSTLIASILEAAGKTVYLVGNIGTPALDILSKLTPDSIVVYELSSFQLWDLKQSPHIAVILPIVPDHLNIHGDMETYVSAKSNIARHQTAEDICIFDSRDQTASNIAAISPAQKKPFPQEGLRSLVSVIRLPGEHLKDDAEAAILAAAPWTTDSETIQKALGGFKGLPHRIEFVRELGGVKYYDDNFSASTVALSVAIKAFPGPIVLIAGGFDRGLDATPISDAIIAAPNIKKVLLIGQTRDKIASKLPEHIYEKVDTLERAARRARELAVSGDIVLMSPGAPSFDMFKNFEERGQQYQELVRSLV